MRCSLTKVGIPSSVDLKPLAVPPQVPTDLSPRSPLILFELQLTAAAAYTTTARTIAKCLSHWRGIFVSSLVFNKASWKQRESNSFGANFPHQVCVRAGRV